MANSPYEQDVILDADGQPLFTALKQVREQIAAIQKMVADTGKLANKSAADYGNVLANQAKEIQQSLAQIRAIANGRNSPGLNIQDLNANKRLAKATVEATEYGRGLASASTAADALRAKLNALNKEIAARGALGKGETFKQTEMRRGFEEQLQQLRRLDQELSNLQRKSNRTSLNGTDLAGSRTAADAIARAREQLQTAALDPSRVSINRELKAYQTSLDNFDTYLAGIRTRQAQRLQDERAYGRSAEQAEVKQSQTRNKGFEDRKKTNDAEMTAERRKAKQMEDMWAAQAQANGQGARQTQSAENQKLKYLNDGSEAIRKQAMSWHSLTDAELQHADRVAQLYNGRGFINGKATERVLAQRSAPAPVNQRTFFQGQLAAAAGTVRDMVSSGQISASGAQRNAQMDVARRQVELQNALTAGEEKQVRVATQNLQLANAKLTAADRLVREEEQQLRLEEQMARTRGGETQKAQLALAQSYAREQVRSLGAEEAQRRAKQQTLDMQLRLNAALERGTAEEIAQARAALQLSQARERAVTQQTNSPLTAIASGRYALAAFARTSVYGAAAAAAYGLFNTIQEGLHNVVEMEDELAKLAAISDSSSTQMQQLKASIFDVAASSRFSTVELVKISQTLAQAGVSAGQMTDVLKSVTTLANASGSTPDEAVNLVTSALGAFQLQASEASRVADLMTSALNRTKLTVAQTGQAIQYVGSTAYEQNISLEELLATVGAIAQAGVRSGSTIGTGFRQFLVDLQNPTEKLTEQLKNLGLAQKDVDVSTLGLAQVMENLKNAGFGSAQAYAGLETRAAAFYLTAKNNVDVMASLEMAFADQGAAIAANERAMDSLSAQWQRFKNIVGDNFAADVADSLEFLKDRVKELNDFLDKSGREAEERQKRIASGGMQGVSDWFSYIISPEAERKFLNWSSQGSPIDAIRGKLGDLVDGQKDAASSSESWGQAISNTSEEIDKHSSLISELEKEYLNLLTKKDTLIGSDNKSAVVMTSLMGRFEGLAGHLTNTKNLYVDLTNAVRGFIAENQRALAADIATQQSNLANQNASLRTQRGRQLASVYNNPSYNKLSEREKAAVSALQNNAPGTDASLRALQIVANAGARLASDVNGVGRALNDLANNVRSAQINVSSYRALDVQGRNAEAAGTGPGSYIAANIKTIEALVQNGASDPAKLKQADALISDTSKFMNSFKVLPQHQRFMKDAIDTLASLRSQIKALRTPTKAELRETARAEREADREARKVKQSDIDAVGLALGLGLGRGRVTAAEQDALHARGVTRATSKTSGHVVGVARDFSVAGLSDAEAEQAAKTMRARYAQQGISAYVKYERGKGKNDGTGRHIHAHVRKGTTYRNNTEGQAGDQLDAYIDRNELANQEEALKQSLKAMASATTTETFDAAATAAKAALERVNQTVREQAENELGMRGVAPGDPQWIERMRQVEQTISQNTSEYYSRVADAIAKNLAAMLKAAQRQFDLAMAPAIAAQQIAEAQVSGLGYASNDGRVPDYVKSLAERRAAQASETVDRTRAAALPGLISTQQAAIAGATENLKNIPQDTAEWEKATAAIEQQILALKNLQTEKASLDAALSASSQIPTTLAEGLRQAAQAYELANRSGQTFSQHLIMNVGGAIDQLHGSFSTFISDIMSGSQSILGAFGNMVRGIIDYLQQLVVQWIAMQALQAIFKLAGLAIGGTAGGDANTGPGMSYADMGIMSFGSYWGGKAEPKGYLGGGKVSNGSTAMDSVNAKLAKNEWVINKRASESVGDGFMAQLNAHGSKALDALRGVPQIVQAPEQNTNVYVVAPDQKPSLSKNDVLVTLREDMLNGESKKLVRSISQGA